MRLPGALRLLFVVEFYVWRVAATQLCHLGGRIDTPGCDRYAAIARG